MTARETPSNLLRMVTVEGKQIDEKSCYSRILADIGRGVFPSGTRLKVQDLANRYGTSIIPVCEALRMLQGEGIVTITPNKGAAVAELNSSALLEIFELLQLMEPYFVETFAKTCTSKDIAELEAIQEELERLPVEDKGPFGECDKRFHEYIARKHYNRRAFAIWELQRRILNALALNVPISQARHRVIIAEHRELIAAFRDNDTERAVATIKRHVSGAGEQLYAQLKVLEGGY